MEPETAENPTLQADRSLGTQAWRQSIFPPVISGLEATFGAILGLHTNTYDRVCAGSVFGLVVAKYLDSTPAPRHPARRTTFGGIEPAYNDTREAGAPCGTDSLPPSSTPASTVARR